MDVVQSIMSRRSVRGFKPDPVPQEVLQGILEVARWAPSADNSQPWEVAVVGGKDLDDLRETLSNKLPDPASFHPDIPFPFPGYPASYMKRCKENGRKLYEALGIERTDLEARMNWVRFGMRFFDAPAAFIIFVERALGAYAILDTGMFLQNVNLLCRNRGLGTCVEMGVVFYPEILREKLGIPESKLIICGLAVGYPDESAAAAKHQPTREPVSTFATWHGFA